MMIRALVIGFCAVVVAAVVLAGACHDLDRFPAVLADAALDVPDLPDTADSSPSPVDGLQSDAVVSPDANLLPLRVYTLAGSDKGFADGSAGAAKFNRPTGVAASASGVVYVADRDNGRVRVVEKGVVSTLEGSFAGPAGVAVAAEGGVMVVEQGDHVVRRIDGSSVSLVAGTPGVAGYGDDLAAQALFSSPGDVEVEPSGGLIVVDDGNARIRRVAAGQVTTVAQAESLAGPRGVAVDSAGAIYVSLVSDHVIVKVVGDAVTTLAGVRAQPGFRDGSAASARFSSPRGLAVDRSGRLFVADQGNHRIRIVDQGQVSTLSGSAAGFKDGAYDNALFNSPRDVALNPNDRYLYVADTGNHRVRLISIR